MDSVLGSKLGPVTCLMVFFHLLCIYGPRAAVVESPWRDLCPLSFQAGDASDPELSDASPNLPSGVEERDGHVRHSALPQHGKEPVLHSSEDLGHLTGTFQRGKVKRVSHRKHELRCKIAENGTRPASNVCFLLKY